MQTGITPCKSNFDGMQFIDIYSFHIVEILFGGVCTCRAAVTLTLLSQAHLMKANRLHPKPRQELCGRINGQQKNTGNFLIVCNLPPQGQFSLFVQGMSEHPFLKHTQWTRPEHVEILLRNLDMWLQNLMVSAF